MFPDRIMMIDAQGRGFTHADLKEATGPVTVLAAPDLLLRREAALAPVFAELRAGLGYPGPFVPVQGAEPRPCPQAP